MSIPASPVTPFMLDSNSDSLQVEAPPAVEESTPAADVVDEEQQDQWGNTRAKQVHGTHPVYLVEKILRERIFASRFWKERVLGLNAASLLDEAYELKFIGGSIGAYQHPTDFLCLVLKLLQIWPAPVLVQEYITQKDFKYIRLLGAFFLRMTLSADKVYELLEPLLDDYRKIRFKKADGSFVLTHVDVVVDQLLTEDRVCDLILPRLTKREVLEEAGLLAPRKSRLHEWLHADVGEDDARSDFTAGKGQDADEDSREIEHDSRIDDEHDSRINDEEDLRRMKEERESPKKKKTLKLKLKKTKKRHAGNDHGEGSATSAVEKTKDGELGVEETNKLRASLGLKPLQ